ncbi:phosphotransferase enzyme family protein [Streptomyces blastmyceticus]
MMTTTQASPEEVVRAACRDLGLPSGDLMPVRNHANSVYLLPEWGAVARVSPSVKADRIATSIELTRWLVSQGFPSVEPMDVPQPICRPPSIVTFWKHYPQQDRALPSPGHLGTLLRRLHDLPPAPIHLPHFRPLTSLGDAVATSQTLTPGARTWLAGCITELTTAYADLEFPLGTGLVHGDAYPGNTLWDGNSVRLGDWDDAAFGPRELDLANVFQGAARFGRSTQELREFTRAYGYDPSSWPGLAVLTRIRDLHTLGSFIRRADSGDTRAERQLMHRLGTLRQGDSQAAWNVF